MNITTIEEALAVVMKDGNALKDVPENLKTAEMCLEAIRKNNSLITYATDREGDSYRAELRNKNAHIFEEMTEEMRDEVRRRLESVE